VGREGFKDLLTIRIETETPYSGNTGFEEEVRETVKDICGLKVDSVEFVEKGIISEKDRLIVDQRSWK
jgi:hypothetical protein